MKYVKMIPLMLFPYAYIIGLVLSLSLQNRAEFAVIGPGIAVVYLLYTFVSTIYNAVVSSGKKYEVRSVARINLVVKLVQIPAYIFHLLLFLLGMVASVWGIGVMLWVIIVNVMTILLTGINAIGCSVRMKKEGILNTPVAILMGIGNFIFCVDVIMAIIYMVLAKKWSKKHV